ncbi:MAG TPA: 16S rRNA (uracil(1498)-N(3))-methyltransferase [Bacillales bacterium]|nr:16S rRNA (uracil(1498)-N(3))-methyltransferase [Bacillales bacterium]
MQRYFLDEPIEDGVVRIVGSDASHISRVMRMEPGDEIICCGPDGRCAICTIREVSADVVTTATQSSIEESTELPVHVTIAQGLPKGDKMDLIVQKGTELGATSFLPFEAGRSIVKWDEKKKQKKTERLRKIAKEAAEQSHRNRVPNVEIPVSFKNLLSLGRDYDVKLIAYEEEAKAGEGTAFSNMLRETRAGASILLIIGPEGGLTGGEVSTLKEEGFVSCGLGPRILRTETAALYALAAISYHFELLG